MMSISSVNPCVALSLGSSTSSHVAASLVDLLIVDPTVAAAVFVGPSPTTASHSLFLSVILCRLRDNSRSLADTTIPGDRKSTRLNSSHTDIYTLSLHDALPIFRRTFPDYC